MIYLLQGNQDLHHLVIIIFTFLYCLCIFSLFSMSYIEGTLFSLWGYMWNFVCSFGDGVYSMEENFYFGTCSYC